MKWIAAVSRSIGAVTLLLGLCAAPAQAQDAKPLTNEQLDQLTAQVALYPDSLLAQLFMATTYPDQFAKAYAWSKAHWDGLLAKLQGPLAGRLMGIAGTVCTKRDRDDAEAFFTPRAKTIEGATRPLAESLESAGLCVELRAKGTAGVSKYFKK